MKDFDKVKVIKDRKEYNDYGVFAGMIGRIMSGEIRDNDFLVDFIDPIFWQENQKDIDFETADIRADIFCAIKIEDLELVEDGGATDEMIFGDLPSPDPRWWYKVEDGYIYNFKGERKNKIAYDYNS